jgi:putative transposase
MNTTAPLLPGHCYHIFNRGNNQEQLFREERNYRYFLQLYAMHVFPIADTFAYCLLGNHFHFLVRVKDYSDVTSRVLDSREVSHGFSNLFDAYAKAINKAYDRTGSLFTDRFKRIEVNSDSYFTQLIFYIHFNPQKHGFVADFREWLWSSYHALCSPGETRLQREEVLGFFGGEQGFLEIHSGKVNERAVAKLVEKDFD